MLLTIYGWKVNVKSRGKQESLSCTSYIFYGKKTFKPFNLDYVFVYNQLVGSRWAILLMVETVVRPPIDLCRGITGLCHYYSGYSNILRIRFKNRRRRSSNLQDTSTVGKRCKVCKRNIYCWAYRLATVWRVTNYWLLMMFIETCNTWLKTIWRANPLAVSLIKVWRKYHFTIP